VRCRAQGLRGLQRHTHLGLVVNHLLHDLGLVLEQKILDGLGIQIPVDEGMLHQHIRRGPNLGILCGTNNISS